MAPFFNDTFTETSNTSLASHTPNTGTSWTELWSTSAGVRVLQVEAGADQIRCSGNSGDFGLIYTADVTYPSANYEVQITFVTTFSTVTPIYLCARIQDQENMYAVRLVLSSGGSNAQLYKKVSGTWSTLGSAVTIADGSVVKLSVNGTAIKVYDDGAEVISVTDSSISAAGKAGLAHGGGAELVTSTDDTRAVNMLDNFSVTDLGSGQTVTVNQVTETDTAQTVSRIKQKSIGQVTETDLAQAITRQKIRAVGQVVETDTAQAVTHQKIKALGQVSETDLAQAITEAGAITVTVNQVSETDSVQVLTSRKVKALGQVLETELAQSISRIKIHLVQQVAETDLAQALFHTKCVAVVQTIEIDLAQVITSVKRRALGQTNETDVSQPISTRKQKTIAQVIEIDLALSVSVPSNITIGAGQRIYAMTREVYTAMKRNKIKSNKRENIK